MTRVLEIDFTLNNGKDFRLNINSPKSPLTAAEVNTAANAIITSGIFSIDGADIVSYKGAQVRRVDFETLV